MSKTITLSPKDIQRFWSKLSIRGANDCWLWQGAQNGHGYGKFWVKPHCFQAHRISWSIHYGNIPDGLHVLHSCDQTDCCNPTHLFLGTNDDNVQDRESKGRGKTPRLNGESISRAKFTSADVISIRNRCATGETQKEIAQEYGVYQSAISKIILRTTWKHIK